MNHHDRELIRCLVAAACVIATLVFIYGALVRASCESSWGQSGYAVRWGVIQGCMIEKSPGRWIPASALREVDQ